MESVNNITRAMNEIILEDVEQGGLAIDILEGSEQGNQFSRFDPKLCLVDRFLSEGPIDFMAMKQTLAALWKPGRGMSIREVDMNLYLFQFYHEVDVKRVVSCSPWSFHRKALIINRMKEDEHPRCVKLDSVDLWVQIHDLQPGFMYERVVKEVGNYIGVFVESCSRNFVGGWKEYMRVRVTINLSKLLKRRMKIRKSGDTWLWINIKYENAPLFCFICGMFGHSEKFYGRLFDIPEQEIVKPYGVWMRAPLHNEFEKDGLLIQTTRVA